MINFFLARGFLFLLLKLYSFERIFILLLRVELLIYFLLLFKNWFHIIIILIVLEFIIIKTFLVLRFISYKRGILLLLFIFLTIIVIEARLGVSVLRLITRCRGNDFVIN